MELFPEQGILQGTVVTGHGGAERAPSGDASPDLRAEVGELRASIAELVGALKPPTEPAKVPTRFEVRPPASAPGPAIRVEPTTMFAEGIPNIFSLKEHQIDAMTPMQVRENLEKIIEYHRSMTMPRKTPGRR